MAKGRKAQIELPEIKAGDGVTLTTQQVPLTSEDGKTTVNGSYSKVSFSSLGAVRSAFKSDENLIAAVVADYLNKRNLAKVKASLKLQLQGPEKSVFAAVKDMLKGGFKDHAFAFVKSALSYTDEQTRAAIAKIEAE